MSKWFLNAIRSRLMCCVTAPTVQEEEDVAYDGIRAVCPTASSSSTKVTSFIFIVGRIVHSTSMLPCQLRWLRARMVVQDR